jgi:hypothetical protein
MPVKWKPDKAPGKKRERKARLKRTQQRKDFVKNMEEAEALVREYERGLNITTPYVGSLEPKFVGWALAKYRHEAFREEMSKQHKNMSKTWLEILQTADACAKATEARTYPKRRARQKLAAAKFRADRMQSRIEAAGHIAAEMHAKMQEREMQAAK